MKRKTAIALSGGIDSLTAGFLLKEQDESIFGIHFLTGYEKKNIDIELIADVLKIKVYTIDLSNDFYNHVVSYFINEYGNGKTPNPCLVCNKTIKFGILFKHARDMGAERLATGHYAKIKKSKQDNRFHLFCGADEKKDQSYFLSFLEQDQLAAAFFPLGDYKKEDVKQIAADNNLMPESKNESQDVCFITDKNYAEFLSVQKDFNQEYGLIEDIDGKIIGEHKGLHLFTIGQRKGINCPASEAYYVVKLDVEKNRLVVGYKDELFSRGCFISGMNWINCEGREEPLDILVRLRYRHKPISAVFYPSKCGRGGELLFKEPHSAAAPGQGAVFYVENEVIAGGWIEKTF